MRYLAAVEVSLVLVLLGGAQAYRKKNVLLIIADDLRPELGSYSDVTYMNPNIKTPELDELAKKSIVFKKAYVQQPRCAPSRASFLTSRRPDTTRVYDLKTYWRTDTGNFTTLPQFFKEKGYFSVGIGKVFHQGVGSGNGDPISWSSEYYQAPGKSHYLGRGYSFRGVSEFEREKYPLPDEELKVYALDMLANASAKAKEKGSRQPFFMALGFHKPHLAFIYPDKFSRNYSLNCTADSPVATNYPHMAWSTSGELRGYEDLWIDGVKSDPPLFNDSSFINNKGMELRRAYYAAVSYIDSLVGEVLKALDDYKVAKDTVVAFIGDHGFHLGEHRMWGKNTSSELLAHTPMMIHAPGLTDSGIVSEQLVEFVDLFPTLIDLAGNWVMPKCPNDSRLVEVCREGQTLRPLITDPDTPIKNATFTQTPRKRGRNGVMGYSIRTQGYRYTEWVRVDHRNEAHLMVDWNTLHGAELYNHTDDPREDVNQANNPAYQDKRRELSEQLREGVETKATPTD